MSGRDAPVHGGGFPRWSFAFAQLIVGLVTIAVACALPIAVAAMAVVATAIAARQAAV